ncbi:MAG TPA: polysaccharide deacetylase family protein [Candidatus Polarisedimenticolia bacterium]|nr:polysaccharide deacetylase family protein [Candidatus Polarisedimenticolia bacterium]
MRKALLPALLVAGVALAGPLSARAGTPRPLLVTVDDLPVAAPKLHAEVADREQVTRRLLDILARHKVPAVGLVIWGQVKGPDDRALLDRWRAAGLELGNHSYSHKDLPRTAIADYLEDVERGRAGLQEYLAPHGGTVRFFRFPYLREGETAEQFDAVRRALQASSQRVLTVTIDTQDWSFEEAYVQAVRRGDARAARDVASEALAALKAETVHHEENGDELFGRTTPQILLLHANAVGTAVWDDLFTWFEKTGHRFAGVDEVLKDPVFAEEPRFLARYGCSLWDRIAHEREAAQARDDIAKMIATQVEAWNRGDLPSFTSVYADDAVFQSPTGMVRGRQAVLDRYTTRYPDKAAMGTLRLDLDEIRPIWGMEITPGQDAVPGRIHGASAAGRWTLSYPDKEQATGRTLLVLSRAGNRWTIVQDASM